MATGVTATSGRRRPPTNTSSLINGTEERLAAKQGSVKALRAMLLDLGRLMPGLGPGKSGNRRRSGTTRFCSSLNRGTSRRGTSRPREE